MKKLISVLLALAMILSMAAMMTACGDDSGDGEGEGKVTIEGNWQAEVDFLDMMMDLLGDEGLAEHIKMDKFSMVLIYEFKEDGTYEASVDKNALEDTLEDFVDAVYEGTLKYLEEAMEEQGLMTLEEYLDVIGTTKEELKENIAASLTAEALTEGMNIKGNYKLKDGKLYFTEDEDEKVSDETQYYTVKLTKDTLTLEAYEGDNAEEKELLEALGKIEFKKK